MPNVLIAATQYGQPWNEGEKNIARVLAQALSERGWEFCVCSHPTRDAEVAARHSASLSKLVAAMRFWALVARTARQRRASVIHLLSSVSSVLGLKCAVIKRLSGASLLLHVTGLARPVLGYRVLLRADRIVIGGSYLQPLFPGAVNLPPLTPHMNPHLDRDAAISRNGVAAHRILYLGAMEPERGVHTLIAALAALATELACPRFTATLAWNGQGTREYARRIQKTIQALGLEARVQWKGVVPDLAALYREHDLVVIPRAARQRMGFPLRLIEALSYGKPVVVSDLGEMPAIVVDGSGLVFPHGDVPRLAHTLRRLLSDPDLYRQCVSTAYETAQRYPPSRTVGRFLDLYQEVARAR